MARAHECDRYYRVPADGRDLNYNIYFSQGEESISQENDYTSHNTQLLDAEGVKHILLKLDYIHDQLRMWCKILNMCMSMNVHFVMQVHLSK